MVLHIILFYDVERQRKETVQPQYIRKANLSGRWEGQSMLNDRDQDHDHDKTDTKYI
jgi:hypothetical protein